MWQIINDIKSRGKSIVLTTHYMEEAQTLCDGLAIMDKGKIIETGAPGDLILRHCDGLDRENCHLETVFLKLTGKRLRE